MKCDKCGKKVTEYAKFCPYCKNELSKESSKTNKYIEKVEGRVVRKAVKWKSAIVAACMAAVLISGAIIIFTYSKKNNKMEAGEDTIFYVSDNALIARDISTGKEKTLSDKFTTFEMNNLSNSIENSIFSIDKENEKLYFASGIRRDEDVIYDIYEADASNLGLEPKCIATGVYLATWDGKGALYYATKEHDRCYCYKNGKNVEIPISCVSEFIYRESTDSMFVISYMDAELGHGMSYYEEQGYDKAISVIDGNTLNVENLEMVKEPFALDETEGHIYYLDKRNLYDYDVDLKTATLVNENADQFIYVQNETERALYYLTYTFHDYKWSDYIENPYAKMDEKVSKSNSLKEKETKAEKAARISRMNVMESIKDRVFKVKETTCYKYSDNMSVEVPINLGSFWNANKKVNEFPAYYKTCGFSGKILIDDIVAMGIDDSLIYDYLVPDDGSGYDISTQYSWGMHTYSFEDGFTDSEESVNSEESECYYYMESNSLYTYSNGKEFLFEIDDEESSNSIFTGALEASRLSLGENTYYVKIDNGFTLMKDDADGSSERVYDSIEGYRILKDGEYLVIRYDGKNKTLLYLNGNDETEIDTKVTGIFGVNSWCYDLGE